MKDINPLRLREGYGLGIEGWGLMSEQRDGWDGVEADGYAVDLNPISI